MLEAPSIQRNRLDFIETNLLRIGRYSFILKIWCFTLTVAFLASLIVSRAANPWHWALPLPIILASWGLDAYFFRGEQLWRSHYDEAADAGDAAGRPGSRALNPDSRVAPGWLRSFFAHALWPLYSAMGMMIVVCVLSARPEQRVPGQRLAPQTASRASDIGELAVAEPMAVALPSASFEQRFAQIMKEATSAQRYGFLYDLPKGADLHNHLNLSILPEAWLQAAVRAEQTHGNVFYTRTRLNGCSDTRDPAVLYRTIQRSTYMRLSACQRTEYELLASLSQANREQWLSALKLDRSDEGREEFFEVLSSRLGDLGRDPYLVTELLVDNMKRFGAEGVRYLEVQVVGPKFLDVAGAAIDEEQAVHLLRARLALPDARDTRVNVRFLASVVRFLPGAEQDLERAFALVSRHRDLWVGVNLTGREDRPEGKAERFLATFRKLRRTYGDISLTLHGGESDAPGSQIRDTLLLGATRLGHALNLASDPATLLLMRSGKYLIETNLISNHLLGYVPDLSAHPFAEYLRIGIPVCLNTDDRGALDSSLTDEYYTAVTTFNLRWDELVALGRNSLSFAFGEPALKAELLRRYAESVRQFEAEYRAGDWREVVARAHPAISGYAGRTWSGLASAAP